MSDIVAGLFSQMVIAYAVSYAVTYIATGSGKAAQGAGLPAGLFMGIGGLRGGKIGADGKMHYNPGWEPGSMKTLAVHGLAGGIVQDRMGGSFGAGFLAGSVGSYFGSSGKSSKANEMIGNTAIEAVIGAPSRWLAAVNSQTGHRRGRSGICLMRICILVRNKAFLFLIMKKR